MNAHAPTSMLVRLAAPRLWSVRVLTARPPQSRDCGARLLVLACLLMAATVSPAAGVDWPWARPMEYPQQPHPAVVRVSVVEPDGMSHGSGTLVDLRERFALVVTNWHVVRDATGPIHVTFPDGFRSAARVLRIDRDWDLAALLIWRPQATPVPIASRAPQPGDPLTIAGYGPGNYRAVIGRCTQYVAPSERHPFEMVEVSVAARQGDSGGPIFNMSGELAGVLFGSGGGTTSGSYAGRVHQFLASAWPPTHEADFPQTLAASAAAPNTSGRLANLPQSAPQRETSPRLTPLAEPHRAKPDGNQLASLQPPPRFPTQGSGPSTLEPPPSGSAPPIHATTFTWKDVAGDSVFQQCKTFFALLGFFTLLSHFTRWLHPAPQAD